MVLTMKKYLKYIFLFICFVLLFLLCFWIHQKWLPLWERILQWWNDFWWMETMQEYSINWHTWILIYWTSIIKYWYILFIIIVLLVFVFLNCERRKKNKVIFFVWIWMFLFVWIRNTIWYTHILHQWLSEFNDERVFFDAFDYIWFLEKVREKLNLDSKDFAKNDCKIFVWESSHWAMDRNSSLYLVPCEVVKTWELADYKIYYKRLVPKRDADKQILLKFNGSYLLDNNEK